MAEFSIGEVAEKAGIAASAIRYYEKEGLLPNPARRSGRRVYEESILDRLAVIEASKAAGFSVAEIRRLFDGFKGKATPGPRWRALADRKLEELNERLEEVERMKRVLETIRACECPSIEDCARAMESQG